MVAREAVRILQSELVAARLFNRNYEGEWQPGSVKKGDTVRIRRRPKATVTEFTGTVTPESITETAVQLTIEKHFDCSRELTAKDLTLELEDFSSQVIEPAVREIAEQVDRYALTKLADIPNPSLRAVFDHDASAGAAVLDAAVASLVIPNSTAALAQHRATLNKLRIPMRPRLGIVSPEADAILLGAPEFTKVNESGADGALRDANLGTLLGIASFMGQNVDSTTFTPGTQTGAQVDGGGSPIAAGSTSIPYDNGAVSAGTIKAGDRVKIHGYGWVVCAALSTAIAGAGTMTIKEPLREPVADDAFFSVLSGTAGENAYQLHGAFFHPECLALVAPPLARPLGPNTGLAIDEDSGLSIRVVMGYDMLQKKDVISLDLLCGAKMVDGRLGAAILLNV